MPTNVTFPGNLGQTETIADLRDLPSTFIDPGTIYVVKGVGRAYSYDPGSLAADDGLNVIRPNDRTPLQAGRFIYEVDGIASGPVGPTGPANNTYSSHTVLEASDPSRRYAFLVGDTDVPARPDGAYSNPSATPGGWVPVSDGNIDVCTFGAVLSGSDDYDITNAAAVNAAAVVARATNQGLSCRPGPLLRLGAAVDLTGIRIIDFQSPVRVSPAITGVPIEVGGYAFTGQVCHYSFLEVTDGTSEYATPPSRPIIRFIGVKGADVRIGTCNYVQFYAHEARGSAFGSTAYNRVFLDGVQGLVELTDAGGYSWVNENSFYRARMLRCRIKGVGYGHNHNRWYEPGFEGDEMSVEFINCSSNTMLGVRGEGVGPSAPGIKFDALAFSNKVSFSWVGSGTPQDDFRRVVPMTDLGQGNLVTTEAATMFTKLRVASIAPQLLLSTATDTTAYDPSISPNEYGVIAGLGLGRAVLDPGFDTFGFDANRIIISTDRIPTVRGRVFTFDCDFDGALFRPLVTVYGANGKPLLSENGGGPYVTFLGMSALDTTYGTYSLGSNVGADDLVNAPVTILRGEVAFVRVALVSGVAGRARFLGINTWSRRLMDGKIETAGTIRGATLTLDGKPTRGFFPRRATVRDRNANLFYDNDFEYEASTTAAVSSGGTSVTISAAGGVSNGDLVGLEMDNRIVWWTEVSALSGATFTIAAVPSGRNIPSGARAVFNRWSAANPTT